MEDDGCKAAGYAWRRMAEVGRKKVEKRVLAAGAVDNRWRTGFWSGSLETNGRLASFLASRVRGRVNAAYYYFFLFFFVSTVTAVQAGDGTGGRAGRQAGRQAASVHMMEGAASERCQRPVDS